MKWSGLLTSSIGKKWVMALTGLFLILFLVIHVSLNSCIYYDLTIFNPDDNGRMFNKAAYWMGNGWLIRLLEIGLFIGFLIHIIQGWVLAVQNKARRGINYRVPMGARGSTWYSKSMGLLGTLLFLFLVMHISHFWVPSRVTGLPPVAYEAGLSPGSYRYEVHDLFGRMVEVFQNPWIVILYVVGCISLAWHLLHGFQSAFRTIGLSNPKYIRLVQATGAAFSVIVPLLFALMPVSIHLGWIGYDN
ncbi:MAG TPA: succinate dehydrogenase cytochrome b subunit [Chitinophagaceae bacterium]|nr:succinate dehydrogenase cytochrome b subunit [Chitinophagaceae bacterium]